MTRRRAAWRWSGHVLAWLAFAWLFVLIIGACTTQRDNVDGAGTAAGVRAVEKARGKP